MKLPSGVCFGALLACSAVACDRSVITSGSGTGGATSTTGSLTTTSPSATSSTHAATTGTTTSAATSTGVATVGSSSASGGACSGYLDVVIDNGAPVHWPSLCYGSWGGQETMTADGYIQAGGPPPGTENLNIEGCATSAANATGIHLDAPNANGPGAYTMGNTQYIDSMGIAWGIPGDGFKMTVTQMGMAGSYIDGNFSVFVSKGGNAAHTIDGTFHVCRVKDQLVP